ncbi:AMIN-like domain-containing (lipo)protein [Nonomuraea cavernae]|uniref:AMIN-like domain-containing (lipo)protein n=1 Tax=Nonomuraea cavernae TaxID=2045107 RepID=UPI0016629BE5|nr:hypothetical protein [Nonomuraea cavernae]MCA2189962.1 hypothetical protein [Nonomuraea cavernae]
MTPTPVSRPGRAWPLRVAVLICCLTQAACGVQNGAAQDTGAQVTGTPDTGTTSSAPGTPAPRTPGETARETAGQVPAPTSTAAVEVPRDGREPALLTGVRYGHHDTFDRVVIDFRDGTPGYTARWVNKVLQEGSGDPVDLHGRACLHLVLTPADAHTGQGVPTWTGGPVPASLTTIKDVVKTGDFEGRVGIALLATERRPFRIREYTGPDRLVIDVAH